MKHEKIVMGWDEIANGFEPKNPKNLTFEETLRFGAENDEDDNYIWAGPATTVAADAAGNIYVADVDEARILVFDPQGKYLRTMAAQRQGPGELLSLHSFFVLNDGSAIAQEGLRMRSPSTHFFDKEMAFQRRAMAEGDAKFINAAIANPLASLGPLLVAVIVYQIRPC